MVRARGLTNSVCLFLLAFRSCQGFSVSDQRKCSHRRHSFLSVASLGEVTSVARFDTAAGSAAQDGPSEDATQQAARHDKRLLWTEMLKRFQGDFDNYEQVVRDRRRGKLPREGGGHEHIHCTLIPLTAAASDSRCLLAAFYFDGQPNAIFRFRYYRLEPVFDDETVVAVDTFLYTLHPALEGLLRQTPNPMDWPGLFRTFEPDQEGAAMVQPLNKCEVRWSFQLDAQQHSYVPATDDEDEEKDNGIHAVMVHGEALVDSQMVPGQKILIRDQLSLWPDELWIHDRGHDPKTMKFIYGNQRGVPYRLKRVSNIRVLNDDKESSTQRSVVTDTDLAWTLGPDFRTPELYQRKIDAVGGPSRGGPPPNMKKAKTQ